ncbi:MAG TPA: NUDIX hydrolase [Trebonia sp.]|nr:NUDIX hydrolase [Trebonia sp.]
MRIQLNWFDERMAERITAIAAGRLVPPVPRDAATVMVLRPAPDQPAAAVEVLMLRRPAAMAFAPGAYVFPGGSVDAADGDPGIGWSGPDPAEFGEWLGCSAQEARALVCAAVRETFEESGVLLAGGPDGSPVVPDASLDEARAALAAGSVTFAEVLSRRGLVLLAGLLTPWARWITPEAEPRRFDARFFAAALPPGQHAVGHHAEADRTAWLRPAAAIEAARTGSMMLLPPTVTTLHEFAGLGGAAEILGSRRAIAPIMPRLVVEDGEAWLLVPGEADYPL